MTVLHMAFQKQGTSVDLEWSKQHPEIMKWLTSAGIKPRTQKNYRRFIYRFLTEQMPMTPKNFLAFALEDRRKFLVDVKTKLGEVPSVSVAGNMKAAINSFLDFHEADVQILNKIKRRKVWKRKELAWQDAQRIITRMKGPYANVCRFMAVSGLGWDEFKEINESKQIQADIAKQMKNEKPYVRIDLTPRKNNADFWYCLVPKKYVPELPANTLDYGDRGGQLLKQSDLSAHWRNAGKGLDLWVHGSGPHLLRSVFKSTCRKIGIPDPAIEGQLGHSDSMNYGREWQDEAYVAKALEKFWDFIETGVSTEVHADIAELQKENLKLREEIEELKKSRPTEISDEELRARMKRIIAEEQKSRKEK